MGKGQYSAADIQAVPDSAELGPSLGMPSGVTGPAAMRDKIQAAANMQYDNRTEPNTASDPRSVLNTRLRNIPDPSANETTALGALYHGIKGGASLAALPMATSVTPGGAALGLAGSTVGAPAGEAIFRAAGAGPLGQEIGSDVGGLAGGAAAMEGGSLIKNFLGSVARGNPDIAALRGLGVPSSSPKGLRTVQNVQGSRPFLGGPTAEGAPPNLAELQARITPAKQEIWKPYNDALQAVGDNKVQGPDGPTTVRQLEEMRKENSAQRSGFFKKTQTEQQADIQAGKGPADLQKRSDQIKAALDPELAKTGINPAAIRQAHGQVKAVETLIQGRTTLAQNPQQYGMAKMAKADLAKPLSIPGTLGSGVRDIAAGRPWISGKPTDVNIGEGFRTAGPKPNFGSVKMEPGTAPRAEHIMDALRQAGVKPNLDTAAYQQAVQEHGGTWHPGVGERAQQIKVAMQNQANSPVQQEEPDIEMWMRGGNPDNPIDNAIAQARANTAPSKLPMNDETSEKIYNRGVNKLVPPGRPD